MKTKREGVRSKKSRFEGTCQDVDVNNRLEHGSIVKKGRRGYGAGKGTSIGLEKSLCVDCLAASAGATDSKVGISRGERSSIKISEVRGIGAAAFTWST